MDDTNRELISRPNFGDIERIKAELLEVCLLGLHDLDLGGPLWLFSVLDAFPELLLRIVWILAGQFKDFLCCELFLTVLCNEMVLDVDKLAILVHPFKGMATRIV